MVKSRSRPPKRRNRSPTRRIQKLTVAADGSGDVFPRELPEGYLQSSSLTRVWTVGFGPHPRGATVGDWTFGSSPYPRKCSLSRLQGPNERKPSIPEGDGWLPRSASAKTNTFGYEGYRLCRAEGDERSPRSTSSKTNTFGDQGYRLRPAEGDERLLRSTSSKTRTFG